MAGHKKHKKKTISTAKKAKNTRVSNKIRKLKAEGKTQDQAVGQALGMERQRRKRS